MEEAIRKAVTVMEAAGAASIERLTFAVAPDGHATPEAVATLFSALSVGTPAEGAELAFQALEQQYGCWACGHTFSSSQEVPECPTCHCASVAQLPSSDVVLRYVDVPDDVRKD